MMNNVTLGRTGMTVSAVSLGTWAFGGPLTTGGIPVGWWGQNDKDSSSALVRAWELGINHWDTADVYGNGRAERLIGRIWSVVPRSEIVLATKVGWERGPYPHYYHPRFMKRQLERSLRNLKTDVIDVYYLHHCHFGQHGQYFESAMEMMLRFREEGKIRFVGLSDWDLDKIMKYVDRANPDVIQPYRNVMDDTYESSGLKEWLEVQNAGVAFFSPLKHGLLTGKYSQPVEFPEGDFRSSIDDFKSGAVIAKMQKNRQALEARFSDRSESVLHGLVDSLLTGVPTGCVLLGQRNRKQVESASRVGTPMSSVDAAWVKTLYRA